MSAPPKRADLHCHSDASNRPADVLLRAIGCPESFSDPRDVYAQARQRGMDFVTITDHDTIDGVLRIADRDDVLIGEEITCRFPEDGCKIHLLVWGISAEDHQRLQNLAGDIYAIAADIERRRIAHAVAHPLYRQNDKLERRHLELLLLLFKGFECLNGAHSALHRAAFEPLLDDLIQESLEELSRKHGVRAHWHEPWIKSRVGGSDDHALLNVGNTWTQFPPQTASVADVLECLREGNCSPGGAAGSSDKLADAFNGIADRFLGEHKSSVQAAVTGQLFLLPHYFALFHQNRERPLLEKLAGNNNGNGRELKLGLFTDTFDEINGVGRFLRSLCAEAHDGGRSLEILTCSMRPGSTGAMRKNFTPLHSWPMPWYADLPLNLPPLLDVLRWADQRQFDAIHVSTPGPMGLCGLLAARMLRAPLAATYHTNLDAYAQLLTGDERAAAWMEKYLRWFYAQAGVVLARSSASARSLRDMGIDEKRLRLIRPGVDLATFHPGKKDAALWEKLGVRQDRRILYCGRISEEKNPSLLAAAFPSLCARRSDTALIVAGDGPSLDKLRQSLDGLPAYFLGCLDDNRLAPVYASSDLLVFPSRTDTLGQVVLEAQASGLPCIVSNAGGPAEIIEDQVTGVVMSRESPAAWASEISRLLDDEMLCRRMSRAAAERMTAFSLGETFAGFWAAHFPTGIRAERTDGPFHEVINSNARD